MEKHWKRHRRPQGRLFGIRDYFIWRPGFGIFVQHKRKTPFLWLRIESMNRMRGTENHRDYSIEEKFAWVWMIGLKNPVGDTENNLWGPLTYFAFREHCEACISRKCGSPVTAKKIICTWSEYFTVLRWFQGWQGFLCTTSLHLFIS